MDYTEAESLLNFTTSSANRNRDINIIDFDKSHSLKSIKTSTSSLPRMDLTKAFDHCRGPVVIEELDGTGVPLMKFTAFCDWRDLRLAQTRLLNTTSCPAHSCHALFIGPILKLNSSSIENPSPS